MKAAAPDCEGLQEAHVAPMGRTRLSARSTPPDHVDRARKRSHRYSLKVAPIPQIRLVTKHVDAVQRASTRPGHSASLRPSPCWPAPSGPMPSQACWARPTTRPWRQTAGPRPGAFGTRLRCWEATRPGRSSTTGTCEPTGARP